MFLFYVRIKLCSLQKYIFKKKKEEDNFRIICKYNFTEIPVFFSYVLFELFDL